jgi:LacI family transcriptional regulator
VPEQVAVLGVDNNEVICNLCEPPLSSIMPNSEQIGFAAAECLAKLMAGEKVTPQLQCFDPLDVTLRQSSSVYAIEDPDLANALSFLRTNACFGISVKQVLEHTKLSRSSLERRMRKLLGHSPQQEIRNCQLKQVRSLLAKTDMSIEQIAINCGFEHPEYLHVVFKRELNMTPGDYRKALNK